MTKNNNSEITLEEHTRVLNELQIKNKELIQKIKINEKSRRKMQQSLMKQIDTLEQLCKKLKEVIDKAINLNEKIKHFVYENLLEENIIGSKIIYEFVEKQNKILKEVSK